MLARLRRLLTQPVLVSSLLVTGLLVSVQRLGVLEPIELKMFDQMMQDRSDPGPDPRLLIVGITETDIQTMREWPLSGRVLDQALEKLERHQPRVIGLDIFRDVPVEPGHAKLLQRLQRSDRIVPICKYGDAAGPAIPPPTGVPSDRTGFSDIVEDGDGTIRRNLLMINADPSASCAASLSFSFLLALHYLDPLQPSIAPNGDLKIGSTVLERLPNHAGGYRQVDARGYQVLLNYRRTVAQQVSLSQVLADQVNPEWVRDRVVLIGSTATSIRDIFQTPYSSGEQSDAGKMPGIVLHAQMVSQVLSAVQDGRSLFWFLPRWTEVLWLWGWTLSGALLAWRTHHPLRLGVSSVALAAGLLGSYALLFGLSGWVPLVPPLLGIGLAIGCMTAYTAYQTKQQRDKIAHTVEEQEQTIALLQALAQERRTQADLPTSVLEDAPRTEPLLNQRYKIIKVLASGGFGCTYLSQDTHQNELICVVKHLHPARRDTHFLSVARRLFKTEAEILGLLGKHDRIPQLLGAFEEQQEFYLVQEYVHGHSLQAEIGAGKCRSEAEVIDLLKDVLQTLMFVHSHRVIHRDIKPSNLIRRDRDGALVLIDFGAVKQIQPQESDDDLHTIAVGTSGYAPPEQCIGQPKLNSDVYALGMMSIQALVGLSISQLERDSLNGALQWRHLTTVSDEFAKILDRMVSYDFSTRYRSAADVLQSLEKL
ncbi:CHASE2 domain-containing protein [Leptolyngbya sp. FACHB-36]|uniref:CHASE2 domain-containing serine/threonine-protein kinase n=1 Tax=Leptolyngbya sp. FACHB-36 TaxID=2692808 RepID=UPI00168138C7|nr:CHASE2 domain-containing serine/threonine-protein kinase [Leptolyngbya sp. FACHB-36]MBD2019729.1 CHASE2 domain-containing protein [Leptolyngbya sp. FACHB-36]